jgi:hypothetical protein
MPATTDSLQVFLQGLPSDRQEPMLRLRDVIKEHLPAGYKETVSASGISYCVPLSLYPAGYHCTPNTPLPFISIASQKNFIAVYHMGLYADTKLLHWFQEAYAKENAGKLDMGKSCIRFKKMDKIPLGLMAALAGKLSPAQWIAIYEAQVKR